MEWDFVKTVYPIAYKKFSETMFPNTGIPPGVSLLETFDVKLLYTFFDNQGYFLTTEKFSKHVWGYSISYKNVVIGTGSTEQKSRTGAENDGFLECFKLLEKNIHKHGSY